MREWDLSHTADVPHEDPVDARSFRVFREKIWSRIVLAQLFGNAHVVVAPAHIPECCRWIGEQEISAYKKKGQKDNNRPWLPWLAPEIAAGRDPAQIVSHVQGALERFKRRLVLEELAALVHRGHAVHTVWVLQI